ncbi:MAG TPA: hypothetical protein VJJ23_06030 [Candidatus Nanoarchaeia archaeon]|nr:hypothetical protein [Candidatus Nanoarchaeia archaeon]
MPIDDELAKLPESKISKKDIKLENISMPNIPTNNPPLSKRLSYYSLKVLSKVNEYLAGGLTVGYFLSIGIYKTINDPQFKELPFPEIIVHNPYIFLAVSKGWFFGLVVGFTTYTSSRVAKQLVKDYDNKYKKTTLEDSL